MIIYQSNGIKVVEAINDNPNKDWTKRADFVVDETDASNDVLISKILDFVPYFDYVTDVDGNLVDVVKTGDFVPEEPEAIPSVWDELDAAYREGVNSI